MNDIFSLFNLTFLIFTALLFLRAAWHKLADFTEFQGFLADYQLLPERLVLPVAAGLVLLETAAVALMLMPVTRNAGLLLTAALLLLYAMAIGINLQRGRRQVECGCGGAPQLLSGSLLIRNGVLTLMALSPVLGNMPASYTTRELVATIAAALTLWALYALFEQANATRQAIRTRLQESES
jgi:hypothetical protein